MALLPDTDPVLSSTPEVSSFFTYSPSCLVRDTACSTRSCNPPANTVPPLPLRDAEARVLSQYESELSNLLRQPLATLGLANFITDIPNGSAPSSLPFDIDAHPYAQNPIARSTLQRLRRHMSVFAESQSKGATPKLSCIVALFDTVDDVYVQASVQVVRDVQVNQKMYYSFDFSSWVFSFIFIFFLFSFLFLFFPLPSLGNNKSDTFGSLQKNG